MRRTLRIFPLYYGLWLVLLMLTPVIHVHWTRLNALWPLYLGNMIPAYMALHPGTDLMALHVSFGDGGRLYTGHFWSLCVEEQFYLVWPLVVFHVRKRRVLMAVCGAIIVLSPLLRTLALALWPALPTAVIYVAMPLRLDEFMMGGLAALLLRGPAAGRVRAAGPKLLGISLVVSVAVYCLFLQVVEHVQPVPWARVANGADFDRMLERYGITLMGLLSVGLVLTCLNRTHWLTKLFDWRPLRELGKISYGFYVFHDLLHQPYMKLEAGLGVRHHLGLLVPLLGTILISALSFYGYERWFLRLKTRFEGTPSSA